MNGDDLHIPRLRQLDLTPRRAYRPTSWWTAAETGDMWRQAAHAAQQRLAAAAQHRDARPGGTMMDEQRLKDAENSIGLIDCPDCEQGRVSREGTFEDGQDYERCETCDGSGMVSRFPDGHALIAEVRRLQHRLIAWGCRDGHNEDDCPLCSAEHSLLNTREALAEARRVLRESQTFIEYARYELQPTLKEFAQFPSQACADTMLAKIAAVLAQEEA